MVQDPRWATLIYLTGPDRLASPPSLVDIGSKHVLPVLLDYFLRFITFEHISMSPRFASLSGKLAIARAALST